MKKELAGVLRYKRYLLPAPFILFGKQAFCLEGMQISALPIQYKMMLHSVMITIGYIVCD